jgi:hypothetical protein
MRDLKDNPRNLFWYRRQVKTKDEEKRDILVQVWDCLNVNKIVRGHWQNETTFVVMLDDGHEQADDVEKAVIKHGKPTGEKKIERQRSWFISQIELCYEDAERLARVTGLADEKGDIVAAPRMIVQLEDFGVTPTEG